MASDTANNIAVILIAAGASRRFGAEDKLRADYRGKPLIAHALETYRNVKPARLVLVTRQESDLHELPEAAGFQQIISHNANKGMGASIAAAMADITTESHVIIALADMPDIQLQTIEGLIAATNNAAHSIIMPVFDGKDGHPVILSTRILPLWRRWMPIKAGATLFSRTRNRSCDSRLKTPVCGLISTRRKTYR